MKIEEIMNTWTKDSSMDETELANESTNIPVLHNKYLKIFMAERIKLFSAKAELKKKRRVLLEYYLGELDQDELKELTGDAFDEEVFGAPTFIVNNKIFWGQDRLDYALEEYNS